MSSGISGDMMLALLISLGADKEKISNILSKALHKKIELKLETVWRQSVACNKLIIECDIEGEPFRHLEDIKKMITSEIIRTTISIIYEPIIPIAGTSIYAIVPPTIPPLVLSFELSKYAPAGVATSLP